MKDKKYLFQKLTPVNNADMSVYEEAINFAFDNSDVKNVAISGAYSAGKSSIIESYKATHKKYRFVNISLAHFKASEQYTSESEEIVKESVLEGKILNQLIHQIPAEKIPQTNFRVKKGISSKRLALLTTNASLFIGSLVFLLSSSKVFSYIETLPYNWIKNTLLIIFNLYSPIIFTMICIACSISVIYSLIKVQKNKNIFRKINLQGNEIEIFEDQDDSYFDKYLNEVLYLFENVEADVVVFEDMDRFNSSRIFERLREVNTLVNIQLKEEHGEKYVPMRFFYLLRDDIFVSKDRTKFFDYIIPIVPIVDSSNSYEQFLKHLQKGNLLDKLDTGFLQGLSLYVDDMRILKNIYNEFIVYIHRLNTTDLDWNKMMAMIAYKNLFPRDFSDLQLAKGFVFALFKQKPFLINKDLESSKDQIKNLLNKIKLAKNETLISQQELNDAFEAKNSKLSNTNFTSFQERQEKKNQYTSELLARKQAIQDNLNGNISQYESKLAKIDRENSLTKTKSLKDLITRDNVDSVFKLDFTNEIGELNKFKEIKGSNYFALLKFLIQRGYIDETYADYMTYFYDNSISVNDKTFLRRVTDRRGAEFTYSLKEPKKVIESPVLRSVDFEQEETLNFDLLEYLLLNNAEPKYTIYLETLIAQISRTRNFDFIFRFYNTGKALKQFIIKINEQWPDFFSLASQVKTIPFAQIRQYTIDTLYYSTKEIINSVNIEDCLTKYISHCSDYLNIEHPTIDKLVSGFVLIGVSFITIDYSKSNKALFDAVYQHSLYSLTFENISLMLKKKYGIENDYDIVHKNYTLVKSQKDSPLIRYISENISVYTEIILSNCDNKIADNESIAISLLNNDNLDDAIKKQYIKLLFTVIVEITQIKETSLWTEMINQEIIAFSESNFINYFQKHSIDTSLIKYINKTSSEVNFSLTAKLFGEETAENLFDVVAICNDISTDKYKKILTDLNYYFDNFNANEIMDKKFEVLINEGILKMDIESLEFVRDNYKNHLYTFIKRNLDNYLALQTTKIFRLNEAMTIITWNIEDEKKIRLLDLTDKQITLVETRYSDAVNAYIITNNLKADDKQHLFAHYLEYGKMAQTEIAILATYKVREIITNEMQLDDRLLSILLQSDEVTRDQKIRLFTNAIPELNEATCINHFDELNLSELKGIFSRKGGRRNYEKSEEVSIIFEALKSNNWIYEYRKDDRNNDKYIVIKNKPRN